jgi:hypothetical protein
VPEIVEAATPAPVPAPDGISPQVAHFDDLPWGECPADLPVPETGERPGLGWMTQLIVISSLLLVLFNSFAVDKWARSLPVTEYSGQIIDAADAWHGMMDNFDLNLPLETGRTAWQWVKALQWSSEADTPPAPSEGAVPSPSPAKGN